VTGAYASLPAATFAAAHAVWQVALIALVAQLVLRALSRRSAALRHAIGLAGLAAMAIAPVVTFVVYRRAPAAPAPVADMPGPVMVHGADWLAVIVPMLWLTGVAALAVRQLIGWRAVIALGHGAAPGAWALRVDQLRRRLGIARPVAVCTQRAGTPFTAHAWRPIVWLPALWGALPAAQRDALAAHELAHVRRLDWIWNAVQSALEAVLWFHPAAWRLGDRVRRDREHACDDLAVAICGDPIALVEALVSLEHHARPAARLALAAGGGQLLERTRRLLAAPTAPARIPLGLVGVLVLGLVVAGRIAPPRDIVLRLRVDASPAGTLRPGSYRDITTDAFRDQRHYHASVDADGRLRERYEENGAPRPIDPAVRAWLDELIAVDAR
jgi:beta-lactamase regulating signal transducer with metallopeptidase domain